MKRWVLAAVCLCGLLFALGFVCVGKTPPTAEPEPEYPVWTPPEELWDDKYLVLRQRLAGWYNLNLTAQTPEEGFRDTYASVASDNTGLAGYLEPEGCGCLPVYRDGMPAREGFGFVHDRNSAFPIGNPVDVSVLRWVSESHDPAAWAALLRLEEGNTFRIHMLGEVYSYRINRVTNTPPGEDGFGCVLILGGPDDPQLWICSVPVQEG